MNELEYLITKAISPLYDAVESWIHDQLDGTSYMQEALKELDNDSEKIVKDILNIIVDVTDAYIYALPNPDLPRTLAGQQVSHGYRMAINDVKKMLEEAKENV